MDGKGRWTDNIFVERLWRSVKYESESLYLALRFWIVAYMELTPPRKSLIGKHLA